MIGCLDTSKTMSLTVSSTFWLRVRRSLLILIGAAIYTHSPGVAWRIEYVDVWGSSVGFVSQEDLDHASKQEEQNTRLSGDITSAQSTYFVPPSLSTSYTHTYYLFESRPSNRWRAAVSHPHGQKTSQFFAHFTPPFPEHLLHPHLVFSLHF